jgi:hypothetical protein
VKDGTSLRGKNKVLMLFLWLSYLKITIQDMYIVPVSKPFAVAGSQFITLAPYIGGKVQQPLPQNHHNEI